MVFQLTVYFPYSFALFHAFPLRGRWPSETRSDEVFFHVVPIFPPHPSRLEPEFPPHPPQAVPLPLKGKAFTYLADSLKGKAFDHHCLSDDFIELAFQLTGYHPYSFALFHAFPLRGRWPSETRSDEVFFHVVPIFPPHPSRLEPEFPPHPPQAVPLPLKGKAFTYLADSLKGKAFDHHSSFFFAPEAGFFHIRPRRTSRSLHTPSKLPLISALEYRTTVFPSSCNARSLSRSAAAPASSKC